MPTKFIPRVPNELQLQIVQSFDNILKLKRAGKTEEASIAIDIAKRYIRQALDIHGLDWITRAKLGDWNMQLDHIKIWLSI